MAFYEKKWWKALFDKKENKKIDSLKDIEAIKEGILDLKDEVKYLLPELEKLEELEKEREVARAGIIKINLNTQAEVLDKLLERYQFFQNDIDINGIRLKAIATNFLKHAKKAGLNDLVSEKKQDVKWKFYW